LKYGIIYNYCTSLHIFNNISVMSWRSVILVEEAGGPGENHRPVASNWQTLSHIVVDPTTIPSRPRRPLPWMWLKHLNIIQVYNLKHTSIILGICTCTGDNLPYRVVGPCRLSISVNVSILQDSCKILIYSKFCF
jgi:hypothetical protein